MSSKYKNGKTESIRKSRARLFLKQKEVEKREKKVLEDKRIVGLQKDSINEKQADIDSYINFRKKPHQIHDRLNGLYEWFRTTQIDSFIPVLMGLLEVALMEAGALIREKSPNETCFFAKNGSFVIYYGFMDDGDCCASIKKVFEPIPYSDSVPEMGQLENELYLRFNRGKDWCYKISDVLKFIGH